MDIQYKKIIYYMRMELEEMVECIRRMERNFDLFEILIDIKQS